MPQRADREVMLRNAAMCKAAVGSNCLQRHCRIPARKEFPAEYHRRNKKYRLCKPRNESVHRLHGGDCDNLRAGRHAL